MGYLFTEIQKKLVETINHTDWYGLLNHFITKSEFQEILEKLVFEVENLESWDQSGITAKTSLFVSKMIATRLIFLSSHLIAVCHLQLPETAIAQYWFL